MFMPSSLSSQGHAKAQVYNAALKDRPHLRRRRSCDSESMYASSRNIMLAASHKTLQALVEALRWKCSLEIVFAFYGVCWLCHGSCSEEGSASMSTAVDVCWPTSSSDSSAGSELSSELALPS